MRHIYTNSEVLAFIEAAERFPNTPEKEIYVRWLVKEYECRIKGAFFTMNINTDNAKLQDTTRSTQGD